MEDLFCWVIVFFLYDVKNICWLFPHHFKVIKKFEFNFPTSHKYKIIKDYESFKSIQVKKIKTSSVFCLIFGIFYNSSNTSQTKATIFKQIMLFIQNRSTEPKLIKHLTLKNLNTKRKTNVGLSVKDLNNKI